MQHEWQKREKGPRWPRRPDGRPKPVHRLTAREWLFQIAGAARAVMLEDGEDPAVVREAARRLMRSCMRFRGISAA
jgi:hypothetical protein